MKKILYVLVLCVFSVIANARPNFVFFDPALIELNRPYIDLEYTNLHGLTLEKADKEAYFEGALRYYYGYTKRLDIPFPKDYAAASMWFYEAGMQDHPMAAYFLANVYIKQQGVALDYKTAIWWYEKAYKLGVKEAGLDLAKLYYGFYNNPQAPESYKDLYLEKITYYLDDLINRGEPRAFYNKALMLLETKDLTRFVMADAEKLLLDSLDIFARQHDQISSYEVLKLMSYYKMPEYNNALHDFNNNFPSRNKTGF